jgi:hypothetical protein
MTILVIGRMQQIVDNVVAVLGSEGFPAVGVLDSADPVSRLREGGFSGVLIGGAVTECPRAELKDIAEQQGIPAIDVFIRFEDPETFLRQEIVPVLRERVARQ